MNLYDPITAFGLGMVFMSVVALLILAERRRNNRDWSRRCYSLQIENSKLRADNLRLNNHPSTRTNDFDQHWESAFRDHTDRAQARIASVAPVVPIQRRGGSS